MTKRKMTSGDLQNITQKTKDRGTQTTRKTGGEQRCPGKVKKCTPHSVTFVKTAVANLE